MSNAPETEPNKDEPADHRDNSSESLGVGDTVADPRSDSIEERDSPLTDDLAPPGTDSDEEQLPE